MYEEHFGLKDKPFNLIPDPDYLYMSQKHRVALSLLEYALMETAAGLTVITGEVGAGKTTLVRKLMRRINYSELVIGLINNTSRLDENLLSWVASAYSLPHEGKDNIELFKDFQKYLIEQYAEGKRTVLIVDEAQNLGKAALEELRMLTNINADRDQLLQIVLIGQPELLDLLSQPDLAQIAQRVSVEYHLNPLDVDEVAEYIRHRMMIAGSNVDVFEEDAVKAIFFYSGGVPRLINTLCDYSLVHVYAANKRSVDLETIAEIKQGRRIGGINNHLKDKDAVEAVRSEILEKYSIDLANN